MRILYHFRTQGTGAEGVHIAGVARAFEGLGHEVVFSSPTGIDPRQSAGDNPFADGKRRRSLLARIAAAAPRIVFEFMELAYNAVAWLRNRRILRERTFELIYERHAFFLCSTALLAAKHRIPLVVEVNELSGDERIRATPVLQPLAAWADRWVFRQATAIVTVSPHLKRRIVAMGIDENKVVVLPNAVDREMLAAPDGRVTMRARLGLADEIAIGFVGWFVPWHRLDRLIAEFAAVAAELPTIRLVLVGDGPLREDLVAQAEKLGVRERLIFPGSIPHAEVPSVLDAMDVAVVPHSNEYRSPIKLFEAMARSRAVLAPRTEPIISVVADGETALLFDPESATELRARLMELARDGDLRSRLGNAARALIEQKHQWRHNAEAVLAAVIRGRV